MIDLLYYAMAGAFFTHELDAVKRHEWRVLPLIRALPDRIGEQLFIWGHVPLFALLMWGGDGTATSATRIGLSGFAILHLGLHILFHRHPRYEFNTASSWGLIILTALLGAAYLLVVMD
ncbi:MAG: hypothetical protein LW715_09015 [Rhodobacter sp.]|jgi:hypothetical protein|nr:hypothetical protein [Rhodobacter sp.]MCE2748897.1 hypothetical protein [Rhodobacter sp.]